MTAAWDEAVFGLVDVELVATPDEARYELTLFVNGASDLSARAIANARQLCETSLAGRYDLHVIDVNDDPAAVLAHRLIAAPTLVKSRPLPERKIVGDLSQMDKVLQALGLPVTATIARRVG
ncbi:MAG: circadian clock protein KaiB [Actinomycetota bacterium]|jgi:circadian clock protein KaiB